MSSALWAEVAAAVDASRVAVERDQARVAATAEVFTPTALTVEMVSRLEPVRYAPGRSVLDPACGDGQFLVTVKWAKVLVHGMAEDAAVADLFGIDLMADNVAVCRARLGGGTIVVGDALRPDRHVAGQTDTDRQVLASLLGSDRQPTLL